MVSAGFVSPLIYLIFVISWRLYDWRRYIRSIIRRFSWVVLSLMRYLYRLFELVQIVSGSGSGRCSSLVIVVLIAVVASNLWVIAYSSEASTLRVMRLHLIED